MNQIATKTKFWVYELNHFIFEDYVCQIAITNSYSYWCLWLDNYYCAQFGVDKLNKDFSRDKMLPFFFDCCDNPDANVQEHAMVWMYDPRDKVTREKNQK